MDNLRMALENISDSYDDFVRGVMGIATKNGGKEMILDYISSNPQAGTSDVLGYIFSDVYEIADDIPQNKRHITAAML